MDNMLCPSNPPIMLISTNHPPLCTMYAVGTTHYVLCARPCTMYVYYVLCTFLSSMHFVSCTVHHARAMHSIHITYQTSCLPHHTFCCGIRACRARMLRGTHATMLNTPMDMLPVMNESRDTQRHARSHMRQLHGQSLRER